MTEKEYNGARKRLRKLFGLNQTTAPPFAGGGVAPPPPPPLPQPPLDIYSNTAYGYSLRKLRTAYSGPAISVTNAANIAPVNIGFNPAGELDVLALQLFINSNGPGPFYVRTWYDQGTAANHWISLVGQGVVTIQNCPAIADAAGNIFTNNGKPCIKFGLGGVPTWLSSLPSSINSKYFMISGYADNNAFAQQFFHYPESNVSSNRARGAILIGRTPDSFFSSDFSSSNETRSVVFIPSRFILQSQHNTTTLKTNIYLNNNLLSISSESPIAPPSSPTYRHIGAILDGTGTSGLFNSFYFQGNIQEHIEFDSPNEIYRIGLTGNIVQYWGI